MGVCVCVCFSPPGNNVLSLEFKLRYFKNLKLFSIKVKDLFQPTVLREKSNGFLLFLTTHNWQNEMVDSLHVPAMKFIG